PKTRKLVFDGRKGSCYLGEFRRSTNTDRAKTRSWVQHSVGSATSLGWANRLRHPRSINTRVRYNLAFGGRLRSTQRNSRATTTGTAVISICYNATNETTIGASHPSHR